MLKVWDGKSFHHHKMTFNPFPYFEDWLNLRCNSVNKCILAQHIPKAQLSQLQSFSPLICVSSYLDFGLEPNFCDQLLFWPDKISLFLLLLKQAIEDYLLVTEILYFQHGCTCLDINMSSHAENFKIGNYIKVNMKNLM